MKTPRYHARHLVLSALGGALAALVCAGLALYLLLGPQCFTLVEAWGVVQARFVEDFDRDKAVDSALAGLVDGLGNRWSYYLTAAEYEAQEQRRDNSYVGIGVTITYAEDGLHIQSVAEGSPAQEAALQPGEIIIAADGHDLTGENAADGVSYIQGQEGTQVVLTLLDLTGERRQVSVTRARIQSRSVSAQELLEGQVGYVKLENFYSGSAEQLNEAVDRLIGEGAAALVFDMRNNGGGYVSELSQMLDHLLPEGAIFRTQYRDGREEVTTSDPACVDLPMAVLVNENTYSAAEFFAAQLRESVDALVVGEETSGKGNSQQAIRLFNGGALNLSTARYTTGAGVSLVGTGVTLDAQLSLDEEAAYALAGGRLEHGEDAQLQKALELLGF